MKGGITIFITLDYTLSTPEERTQYVRELLKQYKEPIPNSVLNILSDYILFVKDKNQTKKERYTEKPIVTSNRETTVNKRQISYEGLADKLENGEDGIYNLIANDPDQKLDAREPITAEDIETIPGIKECMQIIDTLKIQYTNATGVKRRKLRTSIIDTWKQAYLIKSSHLPTFSGKTADFLRSIAMMEIPEEIKFTEDMIPYSDKPLSLLNPEHVSFLLQYYQKLKQESWENLHCDMRWHLIDLENLTDAALEKKYPLLYDILIWKIDGLTNTQIREEVLNKYGEDHSEQYYSTVWRKRIPKLIAEQAQKYFLNNFYRQRPAAGYWKVCSKCGRRKLGHPLFFAHNSSKDGWYSQCKDCRNNTRRKTNNKK